jgi:hypothetical protein
LFKTDSQLPAPSSTVRSQYSVFSVYGGNEAVA